MSWALITTVAMLLTNSVSLGLAASVETSSITAKFQAVTVSTENEFKLQEIPYTINNAEIQGVSELLAPGLGTVVADFSTTLPVTNSITRYTAINAEGEAVAQDVFIPRIKENLVFGAANSVRAMIFVDPRLFEWENADLIELYDRLDDSPNFQLTAQQVRDAQSLRYTDEPLIGQIEQLTQDVAVKYLQEKGSIPDPDSDQP